MRRFLAFAFAMSALVLSAAWAKDRWDALIFLAKGMGALFSVPVFLAAAILLFFASVICYGELVMRIHARSDRRMGERKLALENLRAELSEELTRLAHDPPATQEAWGDFLARCRKCDTEYRKVCPGAEITSLEDQALSWYWALSGPEKLAGFPEA